MLLCKGTVEEKSNVFYELLNGQAENIFHDDPEFLANFRIFLEVATIFPLEHIDDPRKNKDFTEEFEVITESFLD